MTLWSSTNRWSTPSWQTPDATSCSSAMSLPSCCPRTRSTVWWPKIHWTFTSSIVYWWKLECETRRNQPRRWINSPRSWWTDCKFDMFLTNIFFNYIVLFTVKSTSKLNRPPNQFRFAKWRPKTLANWCPSEESWRVARRSNRWWSWPLIPAIVVALKPISRLTLWVSCRSPIVHLMIVVSTKPEVDYICRHAAPSLSSSRRSRSRSM